MTTTELIGPLDAPHGVLEHPANGEGLGELVALIDVPPGAGPPIVLLAGPLVLFALALTGPFLVLLTLVVLLVACAVLVAAAGAIVASPYLLVRRFGRHRLRRAHLSAPAVRFVGFDSGRGSA